MSKRDPWLRHRPGAGLLLLLFVLAALALPLWTLRGNDHPLAGEDAVALCARLEGLLLPEAGLRRMTATSPGLPRLPGVESNAAGYCVWHDAQGRTPFEVVLSTNRNTRPHDVGVLFTRARSQAVANRTDELREAGEPGERTLRYRRGNAREWLIEDHGVLLWLRGYAIDDAWFDEAAKTVAATLREPAQARGPAHVISASSPVAASRR